MFAWSCWLGTGLWAGWAVAMGVTCVGLVFAERYVSVTHAALFDDDVIFAGVTHPSAVERGDGSFRNVRHRKVVTLGIEDSNDAAFNRDTTGNPESAVRGVVKQVPQSRLAVARRAVDE